MNEPICNDMNRTKSQRQAQTSYMDPSMLVNVHAVPPLKPHTYEKLKSELSNRGIVLQIE